jgi:hypothetical protein
MALTKQRSKGFEWENGEFIASLKLPTLTDYVPESSGYLRYNDGIVEKFDDGTWNPIAGGNNYPTSLTYDLGQLILGRNNLSDLTLTLDKSTLGLGLVENIALSTWPGSDNITNVGVVTDGVWNATAISPSKGGFPPGGTAGQIIAKNSSTDYDYSWVDPEIGGGSGASAWGEITGILSDQSDLIAALNGKQPSDADLTAIAGLTPSNDDIIQRKGGVWTSRSLAQLEIDLGINNVDNTSDINKPVSTLQAAAIALKQDTLVSGGNIKTVNGQSILGSGNITISGGTAYTFSDGLVESSGNVTIPANGITSAKINAGAVNDSKISDVAWAKITGTPSTISGYGITDAVSITGIQTLTNKTLTAPKINVGSDATGDTYYRDASGNLVRIPVGSDGQVLKVISGLPAWGTDLSGGGSTYFFNASDFNESGSTVSIDYANGQAAGSGSKGFLTAADWLMFSGKQDQLVSGTNIKTVNGVSILGSGNISISAGTTYTFGGGLTETGGAVSISNGGVTDAKIATVSWAKITSTPTTLAGYGITDGVSLTGTQTLSNKTLTSPKINVGSDAAGDIYTRDGSGNLIRIPIGSSGQVLKVISGAPSWAADLTGGGGGSLADGDYGDVSVTGSGSAITIDNGVVSNIKLSTVPSGSFKGRMSPSAGTVEDLTATQATSMLNTFTSSLKGLVPSSGGGTTNFLRADGAWSAPSVDWASISSKPTTVAGYNITDAVTLTGSQTLTNKMIDGASNIIQNINQSAIAKSKIFSVMDYGAVGNDSTDDTVAFQNCFTAAIAAKGTVLIPAPPSRYLITSPIIVQPASGIETHVDVDGHGSKVTCIRYAGASGTSCFDVNGLRFSKWSGIKVDFSGATTTDINAFSLDTKGSVTSLSYNSFSDCHVKLGSGEFQRGWRIGKTSANNGDISCLHWVNCSVYGNNVITTGQKGWLNEGANSLQLVWTSPFGAFLKTMASNKSDTGATAAQGGGSWYMFSPGTSQNELDFEIQNTGSYGFFSGRFESGKRVLQVNSGSATASISFYSPHISDYQGIDGRLFFIDRPVGFTLDNPNIWSDNYPAYGAEMIYARGQIGAGAYVGHIRVTGGAISASGSSFYTLNQANVGWKAYIQGVRNQNASQQATGWFDDVPVGSGISDGDKGDVTVSSSGATWTIDNNAVTYAKMQQGSARSVIGVTGNSTANYAAIQGTANQVMRVSADGTSLSFGSINLASSAAVSGLLADANISSAATWNAKQEALVSGTNIKTINGTTLLGSGNITISAGGTYSFTGGLNENAGVITIADLGVTNSKIATGIDAVKIGAGGVSNTEFGYLDGVTSPIQTQLNGKQNALTTGSTAQYFRGDLSLATFPTNVSTFSNDAGYITASSSNTLTNKTWNGVAISDSYISSAATWNAKQNAISLTTTGTSGAATFSGGVLNIPQYAGTTYTFNASDFDGTTSISLDYTNGQSASGSTKGYLTSADWTTFNNKQAALVSGTNIKTINGVSILGAGDLAVSGSKFTQGSGYIYNNTDNVAVGATTNSGDKLRVVGSVRFDLGSDATGDILYRGSLGSLERRAAPSGLTTPMLSYSGGAPVWVEAPTGGGSSVTINNNVDNRIITASGTDALNAEAGLTFDNYNLQINAPTGSNAFLRLSDADVTPSDFSTNISFVPALGANVYGAMGAASPGTGGYGGVSLMGFTNNTASAIPFILSGYHGSASPTSAAIVLRAAKWNGASSAAGLAGAEKAFAVNNWTNEIFSVNGSGVPKFVGLAGTGDRMVVAGSDGTFTTQAIPGGGSAGNLSAVLTAGQATGLGQYINFEATSGTARNSIIQNRNSGTDNITNLSIRPFTGNSSPVLEIMPAGTGFSSTFKSGLYLYNSSRVTDDVNFDLFAIRAAGSNGFIIASEKGGTGTLRDINFQVAGVNSLSISGSTGAVTLNAGSNTLVMPTTRPGTNGYVPSWNTTGAFAGWVAASGGGGGGESLAATLSIGNTTGNAQPIIFGQTGTNRNLQLFNNGTTDNLGIIQVYPSSGTNVGTLIQLVPKGTGFNAATKAGMDFYNTDRNADATNYEFLRIMAAGTTGHTINSIAGGTGTTRDISFQTNSVSRLVISGSTGTISLPALTGSVTEMVTITAAGVIGRQAIPSGGGSGVTNVSGGTTGLTFSNPTTTPTMSGTLSIANGGTGTSSPNLSAGTGISITGTWPNNTISATNSDGSIGMTFTGAVTGASTTSYTGSLQVDNGEAGIMELYFVAKTSDGEAVTRKLRIAYNAISASTISFFDAEDAYAQKATDPALLGVTFGYGSNGSGDLVLTITGVAGYSIETRCYVRKYPVGFSS